MAGIRVEAVAGSIGVVIGGRAEVVAGCDVPVTLRTETRLPAAVCWKCRPGIGTGSSGSLGLYCSGVSARMLGLCRYFMMLLASLLLSV